MSVVIVGAGIVGCATAYELTKGGVPVTLIDRGEVSSGTTGLGEGNALCSDKDEGPELDLAVAGMPLFDEIEAVVGEPARIRRKGALIVHPDEATWAGDPARAERLRAAGVHASLLSPDEVCELEPNLTGEIHGALYVPDDLQCNPRAIAEALAAWSEDHGAEIRTGTEAAALEPGTGVHLADGTLLPAEHIVLAAGPWSAPLAVTAGLTLPLEPRKGQLTRLHLPDPDPAFLRRKIVDGSYLASVTSTAADRQISTVVETTWEGHVIVGSTRERCGFDPTVDNDLAAEVQARAAQLIPELTGAKLDSSWVGFRPWLPDGLPAIGGSQAAPGLWIGTGHEGAGIQLGPITGRLLAQAITGETPGVDLSPFSPDRFA
ncbi:MAG: FAD-binding oxidoreductase [Nonomuraea muscovyensis]|nr:FAD-binding oxidoreductase [Nonomuraea muscovyensis]